MKREHLRRYRPSTMTKVEPKLANPLIPFALHPPKAEIFSNANAAQLAVPEAEWPGLAKIVDPLTKPDEVERFNQLPDNYPPKHDLVIHDECHDIRANVPRVHYIGDTEVPDTDPRIAENQKKIVR